jgi:hypothetical protein
MIHDISNRSLATAFPETKSVCSPLSQKQLYDYSMRSFEITTSDGQIDPRSISATVHTTTSGLS